MLLTRVRSGGMYMSKAVRFAVLLLLSLGLLPAVMVAASRPPAVTITLTPSLPSPELLGSRITLFAAVHGGTQGDTYDYQFSAAPQGQTQVVRDFDLPNSFVWVPWQAEGTYTVSVVVRDITQHIVYPPVSVQYVLRPIVTSPGGSAVNITSHPLVALFSAGPCTIGHNIRVRFQENGSQASMVTNSVACSQNSANFLVAGMLPSTEYQMHWEEYGTNYENNGPTLSFTTGHLPGELSPVRDLYGERSSHPARLGLPAEFLPPAPPIWRTVHLLAGGYRSDGKCCLVLSRSGSANPSRSRGKFLYHVAYQALGI